MDTLYGYLMTGLLLLAAVGIISLTCLRDGNLRQPLLPLRNPKNDKPESG